MNIWALMGKKIDFSIIGEEFGYLTVIRLSDYRREPNKGETFWECECSLCGNRKLVSQSNLSSGNTNSCGCRRRAKKGALVAELAGVSQATVSVILNHKGRGQFRESTINKVKLAAEEVGYQPYYAKRY